jgi:hypothetical protein
MTLKKTDRKLLQDALNSNGGGVRFDSYSEASVRRMFKAGFIQVKPNQSPLLFSTLLTITKEGKKALAQEAE